VYVSNKLGKNIMMTIKTSYASPTSKTMDNMDRIALGQTTKKKIHSSLATTIKRQSEILV